MALRDVLELLGYSKGGLLRNATSSNLERSQLIDKRPLELVERRGRRFFFRK
jgi:hypothetical protein